MALAPNSPDTFMREVDDAVRDDAVRTFFARYGVLTAALLILAMLAFGGWLYWQSANENAAGARGRQFSTVIDSLEQGRPKAAATAAQPFAAGDDITYRALALMVQGNAAAAEGNARTAALRFGAAATDDRVAQGLRDVALLRQTLVEFDTLAPAVVITRLRALVATPTSPAFGSAAELTALAEMKRGNNRAAGVLFRRISETAGVTDSLKSRAVQMAGMLGVDAVTQPDAVPAPRATPVTPATAAPAEATKE